MHKLITIFTIFLSFNTLATLPEHYSGTCTPDQNTCVYFSPQDMPIEAVRSYLMSATKSIRIATYNMSISDYADVLMAKAAAGIQIEYMVDFKLSFENKLWPKLNHKNIKKYRLPVFRGGNPQMHNKLIVIDNKVVLSGSANYSYFGLISNYENVTAIKRDSVIQKFNNEIDELKALSISVCQRFKTEGDCNYQHEVKLDSTIQSYLTKGKFTADQIDESVNDCKRLISTNYKEKVALLNEANIPSLKQIDLCFKDNIFGQKIKLLLEDIAKIEKYVDGTLTISQQAFWKQPDTQSGDYRLYFSPEDNLEKKMVEVLESTLEDPANSFAYISTNFITNWKLSASLKKLAENGVRLRAFFDRGRFVDPMFKGQLKTLAALGFYGDQAIINPILSSITAENLAEANNFTNQITIFDNQLTGPYACNHNKWAVIGTPKGLVLINGSANWSTGAVKINDEHIMIVRDQEMASIYLREMISQMFVYRYSQNENSPELWDDIEYLSSKAPCLKTLLGLENSCTIQNKKWSPAARSTAIITMSNIPANENDKVYIWVDQLNNNRGGQVPMYTNQNFSGKWITTIPMPVGWNISFHVYIEGKERDPQTRYLRVAPLAVGVIRNSYVWGN